MQLATPASWRPRFSASIGINKFGGSIGIVTKNHWFVIGYLSKHYVRTYGLKCRRFQLIIH